MGEVCRVQDKTSVGGDLNGDSCSDLVIFCKPQGTTNVVVSLGDVYLGNCSPEFKKLDGLKEIRASFRGTLVPFRIGQPIPDNPHSTITGFAFGLTTDPQPTLDLFDGSRLVPMSSALVVYYKEGGSGAEKGLPLDPRIVGAYHFTEPEKDEFRIVDLTMREALRDADRKGTISYVMSLFDGPPPGLQIFPLGRMASSHDYYIEGFLVSGGDQLSSRQIEGIKVDLVYTKDPSGRFSFTRLVIRIETKDRKWTFSEENPHPLWEKWVLKTSSHRLME